MATRIIECKGDRTDRPIVNTMLRAQSAMTATGTSAQSSAIGDCATEVIVQSDEAIYVMVGISPTATTDSYKIAASGEQVFRCSPGMRVAIRT